MAARKKATKKTARKVARSAKSAPKKSVQKPAKQEFFAIGDRWPAESGVFMGIARGENGQPDYYLVRGRYADKKLNHADALKFAAACTDGKHKDWQLPDRTDGALLYANGRAEARSGWHWLKPQYARYDVYAWCQSFGLVFQDYGRKSNELEVVLVRRVPIQ